MADKGSDKPWIGKDQIKDISGKAPGPVKSPLDKGHVGGLDTSMKKGGK